MYFLSPKSAQICPNIGYIAYTTICNILCLTLLSSREFSHLDDQAKTYLGEIVQINPFNKMDYGYPNASTQSAISL